MRQREVFELRISTRVARRDHCELTEICAGGDKAIGKRDRKNYLLGSRAERLRDTESVKTLMAAFPSFAWRNCIDLGVLAHHVNCIGVATEADSGRLSNCHRFHRPSRLEHLPNLLRSLPPRLPELGCSFASITSTLWPKTTTDSKRKPRRAGQRRCHRVSSLRQG